MGQLAAIEEGRGEKKQTKTHCILVKTSPHTEAGDSAVFFMTNSAK